MARGKRNVFFDVLRLTMWLKHYYHQGMVGRNQNTRCFCLTCILSLLLTGWLRGEIEEELALAFNYLEEFGFDKEICLRICNSENANDAYDTFRKCLQCVDLLRGNLEAIKSAKFCLILVGKFLKETTDYKSGFYAMIRDLDPSGKTFSPERIEDFEKKLKTEFETVMKSLKEDKPDQFKNVILSRLNSFGFSSDVCRNICKIRNHRENYATWRRCLKCADLVKDKVTARLCLLLIGARQINWAPERAPGLRSIIASYLRFYWHPINFKTLTIDQKIWVGEIMGMVCTYHRSKLPKDDRENNPTLGRTHSCFNLRYMAPASGSSVTEGTGGSTLDRKIPRVYPKTIQ